MAQAAEELFRYWVGEPERVDELCPKCFLPSLIQVPYYMVPVAQTVGDALLEQSPSLIVRRRESCRNDGCDYEKTMWL